MVFFSFWFTSVTDIRFHAFDGLGVEDLAESAVNPFSLAIGDTDGLPVDDQDHLCLVIHCYRVLRVGLWYIEQRSLFRYGHRVY